MRKTLMLTAFILVLSACTTTSGDVAATVVDPVPGTAHVAESIPEVSTTTTTVTVPATPTASSPASATTAPETSPVTPPPDTSMNDEPAEPFALAAAAPILSEAVLTNVVVQSGIGTVTFVGNTVTVSFDFDGTLTLTAEITFSHNCPSGNNRQCGYEFTDSATVPPAGWTPLKSDTVFAVSDDLDFALLEETKLRYLHHGSRTNMQGLWVWSTSLLEIIVVRASEG